THLLVQEAEWVPAFRSAPAGMTPARRTPASASKKYFQESLPILSGLCFYSYALSEGGFEVDRSFGMKGRRPAWRARCRGHKSPLKEASHGQGDDSWPARRNELRAHCLRGLK